LADLRPDTGLAPRAGSFERYRLMEILNYTSSEVHKAFGPLFNPSSGADAKAAAQANLAKKFTWLSGYLADKPYLLGETFTVADAYLFTLLRWCSKLGVDLAKHPVLSAYFARVGDRPKVQEALKAEGLID
jgi:glutathione S-transferase